MVQHRGAGAVLATDAELASLHRSLDPITDRLAENPDFADALDRMRELGVGTVDPSPAACEPKELPEAASAYYVTPDGDQSVLDGLWRLEIDEQDLLDAGAQPSRRLRQRRRVGVPHRGRVRRRRPA